MHPVLSLVEDDGLWPIQNSVRDLCIAMRRETMHEYSILMGVRHQLLIHLIRFEDGGSASGLVLEPHARTYVRVHGARPFDRLHWIIHQRDATTGLLGNLDCLMYDFKLWC